MDYRDFLKSKRESAPSVGFEPVLPMNPMLFGWQQDIVRWALRKGRAALFEDCGLGKTAQQLEWSRHVHHHTNRDVLILAPLSVAQQTQREGQKFGIEVTVCRKQADVRPGINITNYEMLQHFNPDHFGGVVLDECFAKGTKVDVVTESGDTVQTNIENIQVGDRIVNAIGIDTVSDVHRREVPYAVRVSACGHKITSSPNHPYFTQRGWVCAQDLEPGDEVLASIQAMRMVRYGIHSEMARKRSSKVLRQILLSEVANASTGAFGESSQSHSGGEAWGEPISVVEVGASQGGSRIGASSEPQSSVLRSRSPGENLPPIARDEPQTFRAWWQWAGPDGTAIDLDGCSWRNMGGGVCYITGSTSSRLSHALQARLGERRTQSRYRGGWQHPLFQEGTGQKERCHAGFARVDRLEVLEQGHPELEELRDADGKLYFYDLGGTLHPSYSVHGLLVHNSGILKNYTGSIKRAILSAFRDTRFKLCCTATPAPNDHLELGNHADFLDIVASNEMISRWFINDTMEAGSYRLKKHAARDFWRWVATWAVSLSKPSDLGYSDDGFNLPELKIHSEVVDVDLTVSSGDSLFRMPSMSSTSMHTEMRITAKDRAQRVAELVAKKGGTWVIWCNTNYESDEICLAIPEAVEVRGSDSIPKKEDILGRFAAGEIDILVSKAKITGFGLNWQHCHQMAFCGLSYSFEALYQAIRRSWRFGQSHPVDVHIVMASTEGPVLEVIERKRKDHTTMQQAMVEAMSEVGLGTERSMELKPTESDVATGEAFTIHLGDSCETIRDIPDNSIGLTVTSPPFSNLYIYSDLEADLGNSDDQQEFFKHFKYLIPELLRVTMPGRLAIVHCKDLPLYKNRDGAMGLWDFPAEISRAFVDCGWTFHSRVTIWKCPVIEMQRTKSHGLLYKNLRADSCGSRQGMADYLMIFRKWVDGVEFTNPVTHTHEDFPLEQWQEWASPVWTTINQTDVLNGRIARTDEDEKHICPLQLDLIHRCLVLWSNPGDVVLDPFSGVGSVGYQAVKHGRKYVGIELKPAYWRQSVKFLRQVESERFGQRKLFDMASVV